MSDRHRALHWLAPGWFFVSVGFLSIGLYNLLNDKPILGLIAIILWWFSSDYRSKLSREHDDLARKERNNDGLTRS